MRWADALKRSKTGRARRYCATEALVPQTSEDEIEPDIVLMDPKTPGKPKAFQTFGSEVGWKRIKLRAADRFDDWEPEDPKDIVTLIGEIEA